MRMRGPTIGTLSKAKRKLSQDVLVWDLIDFRLIGMAVSRHRNSVDRISIHISRARRRTSSGLPGVCWPGEHSDEKFPITPTMPTLHRREIHGYDRSNAEKSRTNAGRDVLRARTGSPCLLVDGQLERS